MKLAETDWLKLQLLKERADRATGDLLAACELVAARMGFKEPATIDLASGEISPKNPPAQVPTDG